jgi:hypothetical protein
MVCYIIAEPGASGYPFKHQCSPQKKAPKGLSLMERVKGIEPSYEAWEAAVLPLNYTRSTA